MDWFTGLPGVAPNSVWLGVETGTDLRDKPLTFLQQHFGKSWSWYYRIARGIDERPVQPDRPRKSIGAQDTLQSISSTSMRRGPNWHRWPKRSSRLLKKSISNGEGIFVAVAVADFAVEGAVSLEFGGAISAYFGHFVATVPGKIDTGRLGAARFPNVPRCSSRR